MTTQALERAARAAAIACEQVRPSDEHDAEAWTFIARAVLMAVREPDEALLSAMNAAVIDQACLEHHSQTDARLWQGGIDAILGEGVRND